MEAFNIKISVQDAQITLTILPTEQKYFKIVYYGGVLGAIRYGKNAKEWELVPTDEIIAGDLPPYMRDLDGNRIEIELNSESIVKIGREIEKFTSF